jgi:VIT1/CCC1 family predicted Fe2+/Mn2+ transporter
MKLAGEAVFGASDGLMSILGPVMFFASRDPRLVFPVALMGAVSASASMGAGELMSKEQKTAWAPGVMAVATFGGSVLPAIPYLFARGVVAVCCSAAMCVIVAVGVGHLRSWRAHRYVETLAILAVVAGLTVACNLLLPSGTG